MALMQSRTSPQILMCSGRQAQLPKIAVETKCKDIWERAEEAIATINNGIEVIDDTPTSSEVIGVVRDLLVIDRKLICFIAE